LDILSVAVPAEQCHDVSERIRCFLAPYRTKAGELTLSLVIKGIAQTESRWEVTAEAAIEAASYATKQQVRAVLEPRHNSMRFADINGLLDQLGQLLEEAAPKLRKLKPGEQSAVLSQPLPVRSGLVSDGLMIPRHAPHPAVDDYTRLTDTFYFDTNGFVFKGHNMFSLPYGVISVVFDESGTDCDQQFCLVTDPNWNRLLSTAGNEYNRYRNWCFTVGSFGHGDLGFWQPRGVAYVSQRWIVADGMNNRAQVYTLDWADGEMELLYTLTDSFSYVSDVAAARIPNDLEDPLTDWWEIAVLDQGNGRVSIYDYDGQFQASYFTRGSGYGQLLKPSSLCFSRHYVTNYPWDYLIVADCGNNRLVMRKTSPMGGVSETPPGVFPDNAQLTAVTTDAYGIVYAMDNRNSTIYVFDPGLQELVATFGSTGTADNQLLYPNRLDNTEGWQYIGSSRLAPMVIGDILTTELFGRFTGLRWYLLGCEVLDHHVSYVPQPVEGDYDRVRCDWHQSNTSESWYKLYRGAALIYEKHCPIDLPGGHYHQYWFEPEDPDSAWYRFVIRVKSKYPGSTDTTFIDSLFVMRRLQCCEGIRGNINGDPNDEITIVDLTYLVAYLFASGPEPPCPEEGNVDGDPAETINLVDLQYLLNWLFANGPAPEACPY
jgi:hypothetical protein